jgi:hypothetical protein
MHRSWSRTSDDISPIEHVAWVSLSRVSTMEGVVLKGILLRLATGIGNVRRA